MGRTCRHLHVLPAPRRLASGGIAVTGHLPVLLEETLAYLQVIPAGRYLDATLGGGGHARAILEMAGEAGFLVGLDRDPEARRRAEAVLRQAPGRFRILAGRYEELDQVLEGAGLGDQIGRAHV